MARRDRPLNFENGREYSSIHLTLLHCEGVSQEPLESFAIEGGMDTHARAVQFTFCSVVHSAPILKESKLGNGHKCLTT
jgi:hypothetical protein